MRRVLFFMLAIFMGACGGETFTSQRKATTIAVDGKSTDWEKLSLNYLEEEKIVTGYAHDDSLLYIMYRFNDRLLARKIQMRGAILWLDPTGDEEKYWGIRYRREFTGQSMRPEPEPVEQNKEIVFDGIYTIVRGENKLSSDLAYYPDVKAAAGGEQGVYAFEFAIPLKTQIHEGLPLMEAEQANIAVGIEIGGITPEEQQKMKSNMGHGGGRPGGGRRGGGMSGGGPGGMKGGRGGFPDMDAEEIWYTVKIKHDRF